MSATLFLLAPLYGLADSFAGGSLGKAAKALDAKLPGRAAFWGALVCAVAGWLLAGLSGALMGLVWLIYRTPPWKALGGSATPLKAKEIAGTFLRHMIAMLGVVVAYWAGADIIKAGGLFAAYAAFSTMLAVIYGKANQDAARDGEPIEPHLNKFIELSRGAAFGFAAALVL